MNAYCVAAKDNSDIFKSGLIVRKHMAAVAG